MEFTRSLVETKVREYREMEPLYAVEQEHVEMLYETFKGGQYGWRDVEWVVQWYYRRHLGGYPDAERRAAEAAFRKNDFEKVTDVLGAVLERSDVAAKLDRLTTLDGVDVPVASAFLLFAFPEEYVTVGEREWNALREADELESSYPDPLSVDDYLRFHEGCRNLADRFDVDGWTLYRVLWRIGKE